MKRIVRNNTKHAQIVAIKVNGKNEQVVINGRSEIEVEDTQLTPTLLTKAQRGILSIL